MDTGIFNKSGLPDGNNLMNKILVIDDEPEILELTGKFLRKNGYQVFTALDAKDGWNKIIREKPDLILLDIIMPHKDGFTLLRELQANDSTRTIPVIILSAKGETGSIIEAQKYGALDYFIKPCDVPQILRYIKKYI